MSFTVYKSSAGSGKTYTLVKEYLKLLIQDKSDTRYRHILAITFTNKAAAEMKERVLSALRSLASTEKLEGTPFYLLQDLQADLKRSEEEIREKCQAVLTSMLHNYSDIGIGTIDKFVHKIVRTFAYDLQLPINFAVEMDAEFLLQNAIDKLMSRIGTEEALTKTLIAFTERKTQEEKSWNIEQDLKEFSFDLLKEQNEPYLEQLKRLSLEDFSLIQKELHRSISEFESKLQEIGKKGISIIEQAGISLSDFAGGERSGIGKYFLQLSEANSDKFVPSASLEGYISKENWLASKVSASGKAAILAVSDELKALYLEAGKVIESSYKDYLLKNEILKNIYAVSILNELEKSIQEIKRENNLVHISEFGKRISTIVVNEPVPYIYERIGERYKNYLIDEFQDTSAVQWQNFLPLIENALATDEFNMIVGDGKQAIYRWRGGEVEQFTKLPEVFSRQKNELLLQREASLKRNYQEKKLEFNRRSRREIIEFNNSFFSTIVSDAEGEEALRGIYEGLEQKFDKKNTGGGISFQFLDQKQDDFDLLTATLTEVHQSIQAALSRGYLLSDIAILTRRNQDAVAVSKFLLESGVQVVSKESLLLANSACVNFVLNCIRFVHNEEDMVSKAAIMEFLLARKEQLKDRDINSYFSQPKAFYELIEKDYGKWEIAKLRNLSLYELGEELMRLFQLNHPADPYLVFLLDAIHQYSSKNNNSSSEFLDWWERKKSSLSILIPDGLNAVHVLTIHKSKGLEFPIVILPFANWSVGGKRESVWVEFNKEPVPGLKAALLPLSDRLLETEFASIYEVEKFRKKIDNLNLLYVAFTRAIDGLHVISELPLRSNTIGSYYKLYLQKMGEWDDTKLHYAFGFEPVKQEKAAKKQQQEVKLLDEIISSDWRDAIRLSQGSQQVWNTEDPLPESEYGNLMHTALAKVLCFADIEPSLNQMLDAGLINPDLKKELKLKLEQLLQLPEIAPFFQKNLPTKVEAELILPDGKSYRPDRVVFYPEKTVVLDFKTGVELPKHKTQILNYASILEQMGYSPIEKYLLYTAEAKLLNV